uniref:Uncharacterized protein n=1 Tax=Junco hyemalis TaxID=40217 RepID=A0A8C5JBC8_JUNHY
MGREASSAPWAGNSWCLQGSECFPLSTLGIFGRFNPKSIRSCEDLSTAFMESQAGLVEQLLPGTIGLINKYLPGQRSKVEGLWHNGGYKRSPYHHWITLKVLKSPPESSPALPGTGTATLVKRERGKKKIVK